MSGDLSIGYLDESGEVRRIVMEGLPSEGGIGNPADCRVFPIVYLGDSSRAWFATRSVYTLFKYKKPGYRMVVFMYIPDLWKLGIGILKEFTFLNGMSPECRLVVSGFPSTHMDEMKALNDHKDGNKYNWPWSCSFPFMSSFFPDLPWIMYSDMDTMCFGDLRSELSAYSSEIPLVSARKDAVLDMINGGVYLINLDRHRERNCHDLFIDDYMSRPNPWGEQECVERLFMDDLKKMPLPDSINACSNRDGASCHPGKAVLVHYYAGPKLFEGSFVGHSILNKRIAFESDLFKWEVDHRGFDWDDIVRGACSVRPKES